MEDRLGTVYLNAACVPKRLKDSNDNYVTHLSWVEFIDGCLDSVSHRWFYDDGSIAYEQILLKRESPKT